MNIWSHITLLVVAATVGIAAGCGDTIVHDASIKVGPLPEIKVGPQTENGVAKQPKKIATPNGSGALPITFDDLSLNLKIDVPFREEMLTERVKELAGKRVRLRGLMHGSVLSQKQIEMFILLRNQQNHYGPGMPADILVEVNLRTGETAKFTSEYVEVEGTLRIEPKIGDDGNTWSIYILDEATLPNLRTAED